MKIFLAGASGLVGSAFAAAAARRGHSVTGVVGSFAGQIAGLKKQLALDLADERATTSAVLDEFPDAIVNAAAISSPERCEADPLLARALDVTLPATLARLAHHVDARLVHLSSEQVFDGCSSRPYAATDPASPINLYGRLKLESERVVHAAAPDQAITVRPPLLMGNSATGRRSTHERLFADWVRGAAPRLFTDEFRQPCTAENLAEMMVELCERRDLRGVFHWAGTEVISRHALGQRVREHFKLSETAAPIAAVAHADVPGAVATRQPRLGLNISDLTAKLKTRPQSIAEQLADLHVPPPWREWYAQL